MTLNEQILEFLDGGLAPDAEAELMHRMSVSPERREALRSFLNQRAFFARDKSMISVPIAAEQQLWKRLDVLMPIAASEDVAAPVAVGLASRFAGMYRSMTSMGAVALGAIALFVGLGGGYVVGINNRSVAEAPTVRLAEKATENAPHSIAAAEPQRSDNGVHRIYRINKIYKAAEETPQPVDVAASLPQPAAITPAADNNVSPIAPREASLSFASIGGEGNKPIFQHNLRERPSEKTLLERFEFSFAESFGQQFPNSDATIVSRPLITNSMVSAFFQLPFADMFWIGGSFGTANLTHKKLFLSGGTDVPTGIDGDYVHIQSNWFGGFLQYRLLLFNQSDLTFTGGYGLATAGKMLIGELGVHYDATRDVGFSVGLRGTRLTYNLEQEKQDAINSARGSLGIHYGVMETPASYNVEVNTGLFFHF